MKPCIGIISYLPDNDLRELRYNKCQELIKQCDEIFNIPIIIICQNYKGLKLKSKNLIRYDYDKLGIVQARKTLRDKFLNSKFDYIILNDDDVTIEGNRLEGKDYLRKLNDRPNGYFMQNTNLFSGLAISKSLFNKIDIPELDAEKGEGYEDYAFGLLLREIVKVGCIHMNTNIKFRHTFQNSTWINHGNGPDDWHRRKELTIEWVKNKLKEM